MDIKTISLRSFGLLFTACMLMFSYSYGAAAYNWIKWSANDFKPLSAKGVIKNAYWSGGTRSCLCSVLKLETEKDIISINSNISKAQRKKMTRLGMIYSIKYYPSGIGENTAIEIIEIESETNIYSAKLYTGYGSSVASIIFSLGLFCGAIIIFLVSVGIIKTDNEIEIKTRIESKSQSN